ncbi:type II/IV secretion system ATPase subunit [Halogeometricum sp. S1BR25-6]|uniref:Type II/IV secretion system ATPase subunit n=1 Tax=Halogeometricum salsisoli TaxID=2950536 RepID=A0ABU2GHB2_9EURY|nr:type II/IV secretion system ATPase subunit [Halogeometricum sp. S1BR25-6]MDS0300164.1 type II/IV secretion system ATPase subunit [Halogeometricum sp. S1BR25-6]
MTTDSRWTDVREDEEVPVTVGAYTWAQFMREHGYGEDVAAAYRDVKTDSKSKSKSKSSGGWFGLRSGDRTSPSAPDWSAVAFDPAEWLGFDPEELPGRIELAATRAKAFRGWFVRLIENTPVTKGEYTWEHFKWEYYYEDGSLPREEGEVVPFRPEAHLGFDPDAFGDRLDHGADAARDVRTLIDRRTVNVHPELDEDVFFSTLEGHTTLVNRYDLEKAVSMEKKGHFFEVERYWVDKPYSFVVIFHSLRENEKKYYLVSPYRNEIEQSLMRFLSGKLRTAIKYSDDDVIVRGPDADRERVLERETHRLLNRYDLYGDGSSLLSNPRRRIEELLRLLDDDSTFETETQGELDGIAARPEPAVLAEDADTLTEYQVHKLLYLLKRNFLGYERIDGVKHDINVEDISCDGYNSPVFVYHTDYEQIITNVEHGEGELDDFVIKLAQRSGKGISQRRPQVDATLPDGSRAQLTLGKTVSGHGTNYTIRQFKDVPFTPVDLINWHTFSLEQMAFLWLCIENNRSLIFAGGTASGKTTSLNAVSLFIPNNTKIVSIEDTREVELPQRNWIASVTRPAFGTSDKGDIDEFDLLEAALRQRPDYIVMGEVRGEEGRTLFQVMSTGHTTYTTFHADSVGEVLKRFTTEPINVSKSLFTSLDLVSVQTQTRIQGRKVRRNKSLTEINHYDAENDEINVQDVYQWSADSDEYETMGKSNTLQKIRFDRGWDTETLERELYKRQAVLAYLVVNGLNEYTQVAATLQGFLNDPDAILTMMSNGTLEDHLGELRKMESVVIDVDPEKEALVPRPDPDVKTYERARAFLDGAETDLFADYRNREPRSLATILADISDSENVIAEPGQRERLADMFHGATLLGSDDGPTATPASPADAEGDPVQAVSDGGTDADARDGAETDDERRGDESRTR